MLADFVPLASAAFGVLPVVEPVVESVVTPPPFEECAVLFALLLCLRLLPQKLRFAVRPVLWRPAAFE